MGNRRQERKTYKDTQDIQKELINFIIYKRDKVPQFFPDERDKWVTMVDDAVLSQAQWQKVYYKHPSGYILKIGKNLHHLMLKMMDWANVKSDYIYFKYAGKRFKIPLKALWNLIYEEFIAIKPRVLSEATHMSAESPKREKPSAFQWKSEDK